jgi:MYXO-CTERM domain-containing protein
MLSYLATNRHGLPRIEAGGRDAPNLPCGRGEAHNMNPLAVMKGGSMNSLSFGRTMAALVVLIVALMAVTATSVAFAQAPTTPPTQSPSAIRTDTADSDSGNWGLLGLVGLLGLFGLMRRDRDRYTGYTDRAADRERVGRP